MRGLLHGKGDIMRENEIPIGKAKNLTGQKFGRLTPLYGVKNQGNHTMWFCQCDCGNTKEVAADALLKDLRGIKSCGCLLKEKQGNDLIGKHFGKLEVIEQLNERNKDRGIMWLCKCDCGNYTTVSTHDLKRGHTQSCGCKGGDSRGVIKIKELLTQNNIPYTTEKTFLNCRFPDTNKYARFDFFVNDKYLIEYDGEQHFGYNSNNNDNWWNDESHYKKLLEHDRFKNEWAKTNNIVLIRIPYTEVAKLSIEDLTPATSKFII